MSRLLRTPLSVLVILALLASSIGSIRLQYTDPEAWPEAVSQEKNGMPIASATALDDDNDDAQYPCCGHCNHGCLCPHLLTCLNSSPAILAIVPLAAPATSLLVTPLFFLLAEFFFKPPR